MRTLRGSKLLALTVALTLPLFAGCGGNDEPTNGNGNGADNPLLGTWIATSITIVGDPQAGDAVVDDGLQFSINFSNDGEYAILVNNDNPADPWVCEDTAFCEYWGTYRISGNTLILDEGSTDEATGTFSVSGDTLTVTIDGVFRIVAEKS